MRPIFTIHAGEYLTGCYMEQKLKGINVWVPSKDTGIDFLLTNSANSKLVSLQVKFSRDFLVTHMSEYFQSKLKSCGWWTLNRNKLMNSRADFWVLVLYSHNQKDIHFVIINPRELCRRLTKLRRRVKNIQHYLWVTANKKCWEARELKKGESKLIAEGVYRNSDRDFTKFLNNWQPVKKLLGV